MAELDLLGDEVREPLTSVNGYAAFPGTANNDKTCGDCDHYRSVAGGSRCYPKCDLMRNAWTSGAGSDIKKRSPACSRFEDPKNKAEKSGNLSLPIDPAPKKSILYLRLKGKWWRQIRDDEKPDEYRLKTEYWRKRLEGRHYDEIHVIHGYPKREDTTKRIRVVWNAYTETTIISEEFGDQPVEVFAIDLREKIT